MADRTAVPLPKWGMNMTEGTLTEWFVQVGDAVAVGDVLAKVETDKVEIEFESAFAGFVDELCIAEGDDVQVGETVLYLRDEK